MIKETNTRLTITIDAQLLVRLQARGIKNMSKFISKLIQDKVEYWDRKEFTDRHKDEITEEVRKHMDIVCDDEAFKRAFHLTDY